MADGTADEGFRLIVPEGDAGRRLDQVLAARLPELSRTRVRALIEAGHARRGGATVRDPSARVNAGEELTLDRPPPAEARPEAQPIPLAIVYEDADLVVVDKPAGLVVHPAPGNPDGTLVNALLAHCGDTLSGIGGERRPGIVHRLDKETSGLLVVAKTDTAHRALAAQFADHGRTGPLVRAYRAFVWGAPRPPAGTVDRPVGRAPSNRLRMAIGGVAAKAAVTRYDTLAVFGDAVASEVECRLETGRTHQIRVHMAAIGHPLLGDATYGAGFRTKASRLTEEARDALAALGGRQALHAATLGFAHPRTGSTLLFESEPPADLTRLRETLAAM